MLNERSIRLKTAYWVFLFMLHSWMGKSNLWWNIIRTVIVLKAWWLGKARRECPMVAAMLYLLIEIWLHQCMYLSKLRTWCTKDLCTQFYVTFTSKEKTINRYQTLTNIYVEVFREGMYSSKLTLMYVKIRKSAGWRAGWIDRCNKANRKYSCKI